MRGVIAGFLLATIVGAIVVPMHVTDKFTIILGALAVCVLGTLATMRWNS